MGGVIILLLSVCYVLGLWPNINGLSCTGVYFFSIGAYLGIKRPITVIGRITKSYWPVFLFLIFCIVDTICFQYYYAEITYQIEHALCTMVGVVAWFTLARKFAENECKMPIILTESTFFIYAFHGLISNLIKKGIVLFLHPTNDILWTIGYFLAFFLIIGLSLSAYKIFKFISPKLTSILSGGR